MDDKKVEEYLQKHGIDAVSTLMPKQVVAKAPKRKAAKRRANQKVQNEHLNDILVDYNTDT